jgi:hypothetical protein
MTNQDTDSNPKVDQWSNGVDQADELYRLMKVRRAALDRIGEHTIRAGEPMATIEEPLVPIYMYHRYAVESAASMVAGQDYIYAMRGDSRVPTVGVKTDDQRKALDALAYTLKPAELTVPKEDSRSDSAASAGLRDAPRTVRADDRRYVRSAGAGDDCRRRDDRLRAAARSRGTDGRTACRQSAAAGPGRRHRSSDAGDLRRADDHAVRSGGQARRRTRAGGSGDVAGLRGAEQPGARDRLA